MVAIGVCYTGPLAEGERLIAPVRQFGPPLEDQIRPMAYTELQSMFDAAYPPRNQYYQKDHFLREISDDAIDIVVEHFARVPSPLSLPFFQQSGGAMRRGDTAYAHRAALYNLVLTAQWRDPGRVGAPRPLDPGAVAGLAALRHRWGLRQPHRARGRRRRRPGQGGLRRQLSSVWRN